MSIVDRKKAKRVYHGILADVYQWSQKMFDGSYKIFEMVKRPDTVEIIASTSDKKIIVLRQKQPHTNWFFSLPGGKMDQGEVPRQTAIREFREETGHSFQSLKKWQSFYESFSIDWRLHLFVARGCKKARKMNLESGEKIEVKYFGFDGFLRLAERPEFWCSRHLSRWMLIALHNKKVKAELYKEFLR